MKDILGEEKEMEDLIENSDEEILCDTAFGYGTYKSIMSNPDQLKSKLNFAINQLLVNKKSVTISSPTQETFVKVLSYIKGKFPSKP